MCIGIIHLLRVENYGIVPQLHGFLKYREKRGKPTASLSRIVKFWLPGESQNEIMNWGEYFACVSNGHASGIFPEGEIVFRFRTCETK